jgi:hypothetical protein
MYYKAPDNSLHSLDDDSFKHFLPAGSIAITDAEAQALRPAPVPATPLEQIHKLEQAADDDMQKATRQSLLALALQTYMQITGQTEKVAATQGLMLVNPGFSRMYALEAACAVLRAQIPK